MYGRLYRSDKRRERLRGIIMGDFDIITCPVCGKRFIPAVYHSWKIYNSKKGHTYRVCGYNCMRKYVCKCFICLFIFKYLLSL